MKYQGTLEASLPDADITRAGRSPRGVVIVSTGGVKGGGGIGSVTRMMTRWIRDNRRDIHIEPIDPRGEGSIAWSPLYIAAGLAKILALRVSGRADILHLQVSERMSFPRKGIFQLFGRLIGMRVVLHHHGAELVPFYREASPRMKSLVRRMVHSADINIVLGELWRKLLTDEMDLDPKKVVVRFNAAENVGAGADTVDPWHFLIVANLSPRKGVGELLQAIARLKNEGAPIRLTLAGGGQIDRYKAEAEELGIGERVDFTGWVSGKDVHGLLRSRSALVLPSYQEGFPMAIIESLSAGLPVIATPVGSIGEMMNNGQDCLLVHPGDVGGLTAALKNMATDTALRDRLRKSGKKLYERHFDIDGYMQRMITLYSKLLSS
ncbi:glycosyltransferase family 4 protein [Neorhizobium sp. LMR1-1-1.1]